MNYDWNWFFSSFSQCAAALIGIIAAFIISRLLSLSEKINLTISEFENLVIKFMDIKARLRNRYFEWYTRQKIRYNNDLKDEINKGEFNDLEQIEILEKIYSSNLDLFKIDDVVIEEFKKIYEITRPIQKKDSFGRNNLIHPFVPLKEYPTNELRANLNEEKEIINQLEVESKTLIQHFNQNLLDLESFLETTIPLKIIIIALMITFPLTVIYPLHFMPIPANQDPKITFNIIEIFKIGVSLKSLLLGIFLFSIEILFYYFLRLTKQLELKLSLTIGKNSSEYKDIKSYSEYLED